MSHNLHLITDLLYGFLLGSVLTYSIYSNSNKLIPFNESVQEGFVNPSSLEFYLEDKDGDGLKESYMDYLGKSYLLMEDSVKKIELKSYTLKLESIIPEK